MLKYSLVALCVLGLTTMAFGADECVDLGYGPGILQGDDGFRDDTCDPTTDPPENGLAHYGAGTAPWPDLNVCYVNYFDLPDYDLDYPMAVNTIEVGLSQNGQAQNEDVDFILLGGDSGGPDGDDVMFHTVVASSTFDIPFWASYEWNAVTVDDRGPVVVDDDFFAGMHFYWAIGDFDFYTCLDETDGLDVAWTYFNSWTSSAGGYGETWYIRVIVEDAGPPDEDPPIITDTYPMNEDYPSGIPPDENFAGCHWVEEDPEGKGIKVEDSTFDVYDGSMDLVTGILVIDETDLYDVIVDFEADDLWEEGATYTVETETFDKAGNSATELWTFDVGFTNIAESSFGAIKAGFAQ